MGKTFLYLFFFTISALGLHGQSLKFEHYSDANGLSHNSVRHIVQDGNGFLWLGTFSGLNRFDGYEFKSFTGTSTGKNAIPDDDITALELDREGNNFWIGTRGGLVLYKMDTHRFRTFLPDGKDENSIQDKEIRSVHVDRFKQVWVGTKSKGLYIYYPEQDIFKKIELQGFNYIKEIFEDAKGNIWIGSYDSAGVAKISLDNLGTIAKINAYTLQVPGSDETNPYVNFIFEDHKSDVFVGSRKGLYKLDRQNNVFKNLYIADSGVRAKLGPYFISIARAPDGKYWLGTLGGILVVDRLEDVPEQNYGWYYSELSDDDSLVDNSISALYFDASGVLWIGTEEGLDKYDPFENQFKINTDIARFIGNQVPNIRGFSKTYDDRIIVATRHNGLFISKEAHFVPLLQDQNDIASIYSQDGKTFYCGLWNGKVMVFDYTDHTSKVVDIGLGKAPVLTFSNLGRHRIIIGSHGKGARIINSGNLQQVKSAGTLLPNGEINQIVTDSIGGIWFATQEGVVRYDMRSERARVYGTTAEGREGLSHNNVSDILIDSSGKIWAATRKGLNRYNADLDIFVPALDELKSRWITDMVADGKGNLWLNLNNSSVARYGTVNKALKIYHTDSGNRLDVFSRSGFYHDDDNRMYIGGKNDIISFSPDDLKEFDGSPAPFITKVRVQNNEIAVGDVLNGQEILEEDINISRELVLENNNKNFSLTFSSPAYVNERFNKYSYTLTGFDEGWNTVDRRQRTVQYTNLFFGEYIFKVKAMNSHGAWSEVSSYRIKILPPFWLTYKALFLLLLLLSFLFYLIRKQIRLRIRLKQQWLMEKVKRERDEKLSREKLRFFTNISHELRTPLTLILGPAKQLIDQSLESGNRLQQSNSNLIHQNAKRLLNLVNQVLDFRKAQAGELRLKVTKTDILHHTGNTFHSFRPMADDKKIRFGLICESEDISGYIDRDKYDMVLYNLLSNALKFTQKYGNVDLFIGKETQNGVPHLKIEVSDDGIGIPWESRKKIFDRFYQANNSKKNNTGSGIGLSLVQALVALHRGTIDLQSEPNEGSVFTIKIPTAKDVYHDQEVFDIEKRQVIDESPQLIMAKKIIQSTHLKERILIVEDNTELRKYLVQYLSDYYKVFEAENGEKGLEICRKVKPVLCVADVMMPVMDGLQFCNLLKNDEIISHIPVILLTALSDDEDRIKGFSTGADGYLVKPFDPSLLKTRIENIIKSRIALKRKFSGEVEGDTSTLTHSPIDEKFMAKITRLIQEEMDNAELDTSYLCRELGMSSSKLYRKIKQLTDLAPNEFIRTVRLKKSAQLLKTKKYNVSEVTDLIGFNDPYYFSRCFKKQFGYPPSNLVG